MENAWEYAGENRTVKIATYDNGTDKVICITNTGGISDADIQNTFETFYWVNKSRSRKIAGVGLGLFIAKGIFDLHKAVISIRSEQGTETTVEVHFIV